MHPRNSSLIVLPALLLVLGAQVDAQMPMPDTWEQTRGFQDFAAEDVTPLEIVENALNYSFVWSDNSNQPWLFRATNPNINVGRYIPAFFDDQRGRPDSFPEDQEETNEQRARTLRWWQEEVDGVGHPDWILYRCDGVTPAYYVVAGEDRRLPNMPLDFSNPAVIDWQIRNSSVANPTSGYTAISGDMVFLQNYNHACGIYRNGDWVQLYTGNDVDDTFAAAVNSWAYQMREGLHNLPSPKSLVINFPIEGYCTDEDIAGIAASVDGILDEQGFTGYGVDRYEVGEDRWQFKVRNMIAIQNQGVAVYSTNYVSSFPPSPEEAEWVLGSYLMAREQAAYILMTLSAAPYIGVRWPHLDLYDEDIGYPCGQMVGSQNVYARDFSRGLALVNPSWDFTYDYALPPGTFRDLYGTWVGGSIVLPPMTGKVLLSLEERCP